MNSSPNKSTIRLGTRSSPLARWQAEWVAARLSEIGITVEFVFLKTTGDVTTTPLSSGGGVGLFTKEIQRALLDGRIDLAVHSLKDLPTEVVGGLTLAAVPPRESPYDVFVSTRFTSWTDLPEGARVGTGSRRRQSQLLHRRPNLQMLDIRGNVDTRLRKLDEGQYDAIVLAEAGLRRLGLADHITQILPTELMLPAIGQGALALETRQDDSFTVAAVRPLDDRETRAAVLAERSLLATLRGGCLAPVGALGEVNDGRLYLEAVVLSSDGKQRVEAKATDEIHAAEALGTEVAERLLSQGAADLIAQART